jgi:hypothetical protein
MKKIKKIKKKKPKKNVIVRRITIDEKLSEDLIRVLISPLKEGIKKFRDQMEYWEEEKEELVRPGSFAKKMGIPPSKKKQIKWDDLREGQAFLSGAFNVADAKKTPGRFEVNPRRKEFLSIDALAKKDIKKLYFKVLGRR